MSTHAKMEKYLAYKRDGKEDTAAEASAAEAVEVPEEYRNLPLVDIEFETVKVPEGEEEYDYADNRYTYPSAVVAYIEGGDYTMVQVNSIDPGDGYVTMKDDVEETIKRQYGHYDD